MEGTGVTFSWGWFWATLLGAVLGFVAGEIIEAVVTTLWPTRKSKKRHLPTKMSESNSVSLETPQAKRSLT